MSDPDVIIKTGPVTDGEVNLAISRVLETFPKSKALEAKLYGKDALVYEFLPEGSELYVRYLRVLTRRGRIAEFENQSIPLSPQTNGKVTLGITWLPVPVVDGSCVSLLYPHLELTQPECEKCEDTICIGEMRNGNLVPRITSAECLEGSFELQNWFGKVRNLAKQVRHNLAGVSDRLSNSSSPVLKWLPLLQPPFSAVESLLLLDQMSSPETALNEIDNLSIRAQAFVLSHGTLSVDNDIAGALNLLEPLLLKENTQPSRESLNVRCQRATEQLLNAHLIFRNLARVVGFELEWLPEYLYREGRLFAKHDGKLNCRDSEFGNVATIQLDEESRLAVMWNPSDEELVVGDFRFGDPTDSHLELLEGLPTNAEYHWIKIRDLSIEYPSGVSIRDAAAYLPVDWSNSTSINLNHELEQ